MWPPAVPTTHGVGSLQGVGVRKTEAGAAQPTIKLQCGSRLATRGKTLIILDVQESRKERIGPRRQDNMAKLPDEIITNIVSHVIKEQTDVYGNNSDADSHPYSLL